MHNAHIGGLEVPQAVSRDTFVRWAQQHPARIFWGASVLACTSLLLLSFQSGALQSGALVRAAASGVGAAVFVLIDQALGLHGSRVPRAGVVSEALEFCCAMLLLLVPVLVSHVWWTQHPGEDPMTEVLWLVFVVLNVAVALASMAGVVFVVQRCFPK